MDLFIAIILYKFISRRYSHDLAGDFRKGITVEIDGQVWSIADFQHVKPGKGAAFVRTRLKTS